MCVCEDRRDSLTQPQAEEDSSRAGPCVRAAASERTDLLRTPRRTPSSWSAPCLCASRALRGCPSCVGRGPALRHWHPSCGAARAEHPPLVVLPLEALQLQPPSCGGWGCQLSTSALWAGHEDLSCLCTPRWGHQAVTLTGAQREELGAASARFLRALSPALSPVGRSVVPPSPRDSADLSPSIPGSQ